MTFIAMDELLLDHPAVKAHRAKVGFTRMIGDTYLLLRLIQPFYRKGINRMKMSTVTECGQFTAVEINWLFKCGMLIAYSDGIDVADASRVHAWTRRLTPITPNTPIKEPRYVQMVL